MCQGTLCEAVLSAPTTSSRLGHEEIDHEVTLGSARASRLLVLRFARHWADQPSEHAERFGLNRRELRGTGYFHEVVLHRAHRAAVRANRLLWHRLYDLRHSGQPSYSALERARTGD